MAASVEEFVKRLTRGNRRFTFVFTEDFFNIIGSTGVNTRRFLDIRGAFRFVKHRKGLNAEIQRDEDVILFDVDIGVVRKGGGFSSFMTDFDELMRGPFADSAILYGLGGEHVDAQKAKYQVDAFISEKSFQMLPTTQMIANCRQRKIILVAESPADFKRPSLEPFMKLRSQLTKILISPDKGPVVDCQISKLFQEGNSSSLSSLLNMFCAYYK